MDDTTHEIAERVCELIQRKTPVERFKMGCSMYATSKYLVTRAILENTPQISAEGLRQELFLKFYGDDYDLEQREKILQHLAQIYTT